MSNLISNQQYSSDSSKKNWTLFNEQINECLDSFSLFVFHNFDTVFEITLSVNCWTLQSTPIFWLISVVILTFFQPEYFILGRNTSSDLLIMIQELDTIINTQTTVLVNIQVYRGMYIIYNIKRSIHGESNKLQNAPKLMGYTEIMSSWS